MAVSVGLSSYILLIVLYFSAFAFCSQISTEAGTDEPPVFDLTDETDDEESTECEGSRSSSRAVYMRALEGVHIPKECLCGERCGFQVYEKYTRRITEPFIQYCYCREGSVCTYAGIKLSQHFYFYKCRKIQTTTEQKVDTSTLGVVEESTSSGTERAGPTVDAAATTSNAATTDGVSTGTETTSTAIHSTTFKDRVGHLEDRSEL